MNFQFTIFNDKLRKKRSNFLGKKSSGSALIMVMIMMVNAVLIMSAATAISYRESKNSGMVKNSAVALQAADSGMEWAMGKYADSTTSPTSSLKDVFKSYSGLALEMDGSEIGLGSEIEYHFYFLDQGKESLEKSAVISELFYIRSVATVSVGGDLKLSRALEAQVQSPSP